MWVASEWIPLADLPSPGEPEKHGRDQMYQEHVAGRPMTEPMEDALRWYKSEPDTGNDGPL